MISPATRSRGGGKGLILATLCLAASIINLDTTIVNVALPALVRQHGASTNGLQRVVDAYKARARRDALATIADRLAEWPEPVFRRATAMIGLRREEANLDWVAETRPVLLAARAAAPALGREG